MPKKNVKSEVLDKLFWEQYVTDREFRERIHTRLGEMFPEVKREMEEKGGITLATIQKCWGITEEQAKEAAFVGDVLSYLTRAWEEHQTKGTPLPAIFTATVEELQIVTDLTERADKGDLAALKELMEMYPGEIFDDLYREAAVAGAGDN